MTREHKERNTRNKLSIRWIRAYLEALFDNREVVVIHEHRKALELFLW